MTLDHEGNQEGISKEGFLDSLISEIDELLDQEGGLNKFQCQFDKFCFMVESYGTELDKYRQLAKNEFYDFIEKNLEPKETPNDIDRLPLQDLLKSYEEQSSRLSKIIPLYIKQHPTPPIDNPTWVSHGLMSDYVAEEHWATKAPLVYRPPLLELPPNPVFWFFSEMDKYLSDNDPINPPDEKKRLMCDFVRLAIIHDESCDYDKSIMIYKNKNYNGNFKRDDFAKDLWAAYKNPEKDNFKKTHERTLRKALKYVKTDVVRRKNDNKKKQERLQEPRGTYKAQRLLASEEAEGYAKASRNQKCPELYLLYVYASKALQHAKLICMMSRRKDHGTAEDFVLAEVRLAEYVQKLRDYPNLIEHLQQWPKNPGIALTWFVGRSALEVIIEFTKAITTSVIIGRGEVACHGATSYDNLQVSPECDPQFAVWQERTIAELCEKTIPKPDVWPSPADIHKECKQVLLKLEDEYNRAEKEKQNEKFEDKIHSSP